jgi:carbonic anhydrase/acetyltransferase-like protein (isoleucine patch superfamily)
MIRTYRDQRPAIAESAFVDQSAQVIGRVTAGERSSIWCNTTVRGDVNSIEIGEETNVQDNCCLHVDPGEPLVLGKRIVVGHSVTLHGCVIADDCLIGMGAIVLSGAKIGSGSIIAAGALVVEGAEIPPQSLVMGTPGKVRRQTTEEERERTRRGAEGYVNKSREYMNNS